MKKEKKKSLKCQGLGGWRAGIPGPCKELVEFKLVYSFNRKLRRVGSCDLCLNGNVSADTAIAKAGTVVVTRL